MKFAVKKREILTLAKTGSCSIAMICAPLVARIEYNYVCIRNAEDTTVLWRTRIVRVLGPSGNGGGAAASDPCQIRHSTPTHLFRQVRAVRVKQMNNAALAQRLRWQRLARV